MPAIIWPLRTKLPAMGFVTNQQRPRSTGWRPVPVKPTRPFDIIGARPVARASSDLYPQKPDVVHALKFPPISFIAPIIPGIQSIGGMSGGLILSLRARLGARLFVNQQRPRYTGWRPVPTLPTLPWKSGRNKRPGVVHALMPLPNIFYWIDGLTKDKNGSIIPNCRVKLFDTVLNTWLDVATSSADGYFLFHSAARNRTHFLVGWKDAGAPDKAGATLDTLIPNVTTVVFLRDPTTADAAGGAGAFRPIGSPVIRRIEN